jgi:signal peptide peptidase SppA
MKIDPVLSQILRHKWAIDPQYALLQAPVVDGLLKGNMIDRGSADENLPRAFMISGSKPITYYNWDEAPKGSIAQIDIKGELMKRSQFCGPMGMEVLGKRVQEADEDPRFAGIMLVIDSPGGTVDGTEVFANIVKNMKKPVLAYVDGLMASAAAWIGTGADEIWASTDTDEIGSIGVLMSFADIQPYYERMGVKFHMVTASTSEDKVKMFEDLRAGKYKNYQENVLDVLDEKFMKVVKENRPKVTQEHLSGKVFFAKDLVGTMIDQIGTFEDAVARLYSISKTSLTSNVAEEEEEEDNSLIINSKKVKMEKLTLLMAVMGVSSIELDEDGYASLSQESLEAIEAGLKAASDAQAKLDTELKAAQADLEAEKEARGSEDQELANLKDANKTLREENDSLKKAASGGSAAAITTDDKGDDKAEKKDGPVTSDSNDFMTNLNALAEEKKSMGL